jgi:hypothetical protein
MAGIIHVDQLVLMREMRRTGASWTHSTGGDPHGVISRPVVPFLFRRTVIAVEGSADIVRERGGHVSGADLEHEMQFEDEGTGGTGSDVPDVTRCHRWSGAESAGPDGRRGLHAVRDKP